MCLNHSNVLSVESALTLVDQASHPEDVPGAGGEMVRVTDSPGKAGPCNKGIKPGKDRSHQGFARMGKLLLRYHCGESPRGPALVEGSLAGGVYNIHARTLQSSRYMSRSLF